MLLVSKATNALVSREAVLQSDGQLEPSFKSSGKAVCGRLLVHLEGYEEKC